MKKIIILGSTGSIGTQTLEVIRANPGEFEVIGLSAHENTALFEAQVREFRPKYVLQTAMSENPAQELAALAAAPEADLIVNAIAGSAGLLPMFAACKAGKKIALANKESLVMAGELLMPLAEKMGAEILPIDSEPSAIWQMLNTRSRQSRKDVILRPKAEGSSLEPAEILRFAQDDRVVDIEKIILTASGGPFWKWKKEELDRVSTEQALKHPTWKMGEKVTIDSATLINKAFEIIETRWLFGIPPEKIDVVVHRQSVVHSLVQWNDGNTSAIMSSPDMKIPISYALFYPERRGNHFPRLDFSELQLTFEQPDYSLFEGPKLAYAALAAGGIMPAALCMADEIAVNKFLRGEISFLGIYDLIKRALDKIRNIPLSIEAVNELILRIS